MKKRLMKSVIVFFVLILIFTIISRILQQICTPNVVVTEAKMGVVSTRFEIESYVRGKQEIAIYSENNLRIDKVFVTEGVYVQKGDILYQYDTKELEKNLKSLKEELDILNLQIAELEDSQEKQNQKEKIDYDNAVYNYELIKKEYQSQLDRALKNLENVKNDSGSTQEEIEETQDIYENILIQQESALAQAQYQIDMIEVGNVKTTTIQQNYILKEQKENERKALEALLEKDGMVMAESDGQVIKVYIEPGSRTSGAADMLISNEEGGKIVEFTLENNQTEFASTYDISVGNAVKITDSDGKLKECEIIGKVQDTGDGCKFIVDASGLNAEINSNVVIEVQDTNNQYSYVIPREALHQREGNKYFVYIVEEIESVLGVENRIRSQEVEVVEMNSWDVAIENISSTQKIVVDSDKLLSDDCLVNYFKE